MLHFDNILVRLSHGQKENKIINTYEIEKVIFKDQAALHFYDIYIQFDDRQNENKVKNNI